MPKRNLTLSERSKIGKTVAAVESAQKPGRIVRVLVEPRTNEAGQPQVAVTSAPIKRAPRKPS